MHLVNQTPTARRWLLLNTAYSRKSKYFRSFKRFQEKKNSVVIFAPSRINVNHSDPQPFIDFYEVTGVLFCRRTTFLAKTVQLKNVDCQ